MAIYPINQVVLERGEDLLSTSPTTEDVFNVMETILLENGMGGAPEICLLTNKNESSIHIPIPRMLILPAFRPDLPTCWIVHYSEMKIPGSSLLLAFGEPNPTNFQKRTVCGVISEYRCDCLIEDQEVLRKAIDWFLKHQSTCPNLKWVLYNEAVRDADNSIPY